MNTGKVEFAPDYKSDHKSKGIQIPPPDHVRFDKQGRAGVDMDHLIDTEMARSGKEHAANSVAVERSRLEREVIEAAKARRIAQETMFALGTEEGCSKYEAADWRFEGTLTALIDFESKQETK